MWPLKKNLLMKLKTTPKPRKANLKRFKKMLRASITNRLKKNKEKRQMKATTRQDPKAARNARQRQEKEQEASRRLWTILRSRTKNISSRSIRSFLSIIDSQKKKLTSWRKSSTDTKSIRTIWEKKPRSETISSRPCTPLRKISTVPASKLSALRHK